MAQIEQIDESELSPYEKRLLRESYKKDGTPIEEFVKELKNEDKSAKTTKKIS